MDEMRLRINRLARGWVPLSLYDEVDLRCFNLISVSGAMVPCGQCQACRINRRRTWEARIHLEAMTHPASCFATLTYAPENLPPGDSLSREDWRGFSKGIGYRYFGCGEYGSGTVRPHYHVILFGIDWVRGEELIADRWRKGFWSVKPYCDTHASYIAGYVVKKLNRADDPRLKEKQVPEFAVMSRRPAVGTPGIQWVQDWLATGVGKRYVAQNGDVPLAVRVGKSVKPLGRTLVDKLRAKAGVPLTDPARMARLKARQLEEASDPQLSKFIEGRREAAFQRMKAQAYKGKGTL